MGLDRPAPPAFLFSELSTVRPEPEKIGNRNILQATQSAPKQISKKKILDKEKKNVQPTVSSEKVSGSVATHRTEQMAQSPLPRESHSQEVLMRVDQKSGAKQGKACQKHRSQA